MTKRKEIRMRTKAILLGCLVSVGFIRYTSGSQEKNLVHELLTQKEHVFDDLPLEMQQELGCWIVRDHPLVPFLVKKLSHVHTQLLGVSAERFTDAWAFYTVRFNSRGDKIVTASHDGKARIWDVQSGRCLHTLQSHKRKVTSAEFNSEGDTVVTSSGDEMVRIWNALDGKCLHTLTEHTAPTNSAQFNYLGDKIVSTSYSTARIWEVGSGRCLHILAGHGSHLISAYFTRAGDKVVTASQDTTAKIWDVESGNCLHTLNGHTERLLGAEFNVSGKKIVTTSQDGTAKIWDAMTGECLHTLIHPKKSTLEKYKKINSAHFNETGDTIVTSSDDMTAKMWDVASGGCVLTFVGHSANVVSARFNHGGDHLVTASSDCSAKIWNATNGTCLRTLPNEHGVRTAEFDRSGDKVLMLGDPTIWDWKRLKMLTHFIESEITHRQALLLVALYETSVCRSLILKYGYKAYKGNLWEVPYHRSLRLDFNSYPYLQEAFKTLPGEIQKIMMPFIVEMIQTC